MGITRSFNKNNGVYYAYETTYEWSEEKQRKVQRKRCIGQFVPGTDEIIPNGPRGKKALIENPTIRQETNVRTYTAESENAFRTLEGIRPKLEAFERALQNLSAATSDVLQAITAVTGEMKSSEEDHI